MVTTATRRLYVGSVFAWAVIVFAFVLAFALPQNAYATDSCDMYRLYNPNSGEHFYTSNIVERDNVVAAGWSYECVGWVAPMSSSSPVYRLYNPYAGDHHYTLDASERDSLVDMGWYDEGVGWYSDDSETVPLYRQYNPNAVTGTHNFTTSAEEDAYLASIGWQSEGIAWYAKEPGQTFQVKREAEHFGGSYDAPRTLSDFKSAYPDYGIIASSPGMSIVRPADSPYGFMYTYRLDYNNGAKYYDWHLCYGTVTTVGDAVNGGFTSPMSVDRFVARLYPPKPFRHNMPAGKLSTWEGVWISLSDLGKVANLHYSGLEDGAEEGMSGAGYGEGFQILLDSSGLVSPNSLCCLLGIAG